MSDLPFWHIDAFADGPFTGNPAGVITKGAFADVIAVAGDPRADVKVLENVRFVMKNGRVYKNTWGK